MCYSERLAEVGIIVSVGSVSDFYDNALGGSMIGLYKIEVIHRVGPWRNLDAVEYAILGMGGRVQSTAATRTHRPYSTSRVGVDVL